MMIYIVVRTARGVVRTACQIFEFLGYSTVSTVGKFMSREEKIIGVARAAYLRRDFGGGWTKPRS